jgi:hypothetical protein
MKISEKKEIYAKVLSQDLKIAFYDKFISHYLDKILNGNEIKNLENDFEDWRRDRLLPNLIFLNENDYLLASVNALKTYGLIAGTDYGSSRQRDKVQMWSDMTRGYLGEIAVQKKIQNDFEIETFTAHEEGKIENFLKTDLPLIKKKGEEIRENKLKVSIKTTKWSGVWLDCPGNQYSHSDVFILAKVNTGTEHLMSFLKESKFFEDTLLKKGVDKSIITEDMKKNILNKITDFKKIGLFAYIVGFHKRKDNLEIIYEGKKGTKNYEIKSAIGYLDVDFHEKVRKENNLNDQAKISFIGIGDFTSKNKFIANTGSLEFKSSDWKSLVNSF